MSIGSGNIVCKHVTGGFLGMFQGAARLSVGELGVIGTRKWAIDKIVHCKKELAVFPSPAGMSLIKLFLGGNNLIFPVQGEFDQ
jgi:hypothetical protein